MKLAQEEFVKILASFLECAESTRLAERSVIDPFVLAYLDMSEMPRSNVVCVSIFYEMFYFKNSFAKN